MSAPALFYTGIVADSRFVKGAHVFVAGGGNAAGQATVSLARSGDRVTLLVRGDSLAENMSDYLVQQIDELPNVDVRLRTEIVDGSGENKLERLVLRDLSTGKTESVEATLLFVLIGTAPHTAWLAGIVAARCGGLHSDRPGPGGGRLTAGPRAPDAAVRNEHAGCVRGG